MANTPFHKVALIGRQRAEDIHDTLSALKTYLESLNVEVFCEKSTAAFAKDLHIKALTNDELKDHVDLIIVVGGDGSLLTAARIAAKQDIPVLGVNRGKLGFLTDVHPDHFHVIGEIIAGHYQEEARFLLKAELPDAEYAALNDVVLLSSKRAQMISFDVHINHKFAYSLRADGLIVSTPTGSTAYALSAGGPILHPQLDAIVLVPMFPHTLSGRPIVVRGDMQVEIIISESNQNAPEISCDGLERVPITPGEKISIVKHPQQFRLIHPASYNYYQMLRTKLNWKG